MVGFFFFPSSSFRNHHQFLASFSSPIKSFSRDEAMIRIRAPSLLSAPTNASLPRSRAPSRQRAATIASLSSSSSSSSSKLLPCSCRPVVGRPTSSLLRVSAVRQQQDAAAAVDDPAARWRWDDSEDAVKAYGALAAVLAAGAAAAALDVSHASLPYFVGLVRTPSFLSLPPTLNSPSLSRFLTLSPSFLF